MTTAVLASVIDAKDKWLATIALAGLDENVELEYKRLAEEAGARTFEQCFEAWMQHTGNRRQRAPRRAMSRCAPPSDIQLKSKTISPLYWSCHSQSLFLLQNDDPHHITI